MYAAHHVGICNSRCSVGIAKAVVKQEDRYAQFDCLVGGEPLSLFLVADGHGGAAAAEVVSKRLLPMIVDNLNGKPSTDAIEKACTEAFGIVNLEVRQETSTAGCTCTVVVINKKRWTRTCANLGDSGALAINLNGEFSWLHVDHRLETSIEEQQRVAACGGRLSQAAHRVSGAPRGPLRAWPGGLAMGRALGDMDCEPWISSTPSVSSCAIDRSMPEVIVLASDGLWDFTSVTAVCKCVRAQSDAQSAALMLMALIDSSSKRPRDDATILVVGLTSACSQPSSPQSSSISFRGGGIFNMLMRRSRPGNSPNGRRSSGDFLASPSSVPDELSVSTDDGSESSSDSTKGGAIWSSFSLPCPEIDLLPEV